MCVIGAIRLSNVWPGNAAKGSPATTGSSFEFTPILKPLERFRDQTLVLTNLMCHNANALGFSLSGVNFVVARMTEVNPPAGQKARTWDVV